jgi:O-antigen/teichoic acid export membrane protein
MSSNKIVAKNTMFLYVRMLITMVISLFTSRIVIDALGFSDYGLYSLVGGITGLIAFMHTSLAGATIRFMNIEMGIKNIGNLKTVFNTAIIIHVSLALIILVLGETVGLWFLYNKINITPDRFDAAFWVYQFSVLSVMMSIVQAPYDAAIVAHQRMSIYAYISIVESVLKLVIAYIIYISLYDKLILYAGLVLAVSIITRMIYQIYCFRNFEECRFKWVINKEYIKSIAVFFGWDLFGNFSFIFKNQGLQIIQNIFFGSIINASVGIANTITGIVSGFASNFSIAAKPQITQYYSQGEYQKMLELLYFNVRITFFLMFCFSIPFFLQADYLFTLWLVDVPEYTVIFCQLILFQISFSRLYTPLNDIIHASGNIRKWSSIGGLVNILNIVLSYFLLKIIGNPVTPFYVGIFCLFLSFSINVYYTKIYIKEFSVKHYLLRICLKNCIIAFVGILPSFLMLLYFKSSVLFSLFSIVFGVVFYFLSVYFLGLRPNEKEYLKSKTNYFLTIIKF